MDARRVAWSAHNRSIHRKVEGRPDVAAGEGTWVDTIVDHEGLPAAVVVCGDGRVATLRLADIRVTET